MKKIVLKGAIIIAAVSVICLLPNTVPVMFLLSLFSAALLLIIVLALAIEMKIFHKIFHYPHSKIRYKNIEVSYSWNLNGGGIIFVYEFVRIVSRKIGRIGHVFEYCSGPGFIGFGLLANNLCDKLTLSDVNPRAIEAIKETIQNNNLQDKVVAYQSDCLDSIPANEQWDLVVANPPWDLCLKDNKHIMVCDPRGRVHEKFYQDIKKFLKPNGSILFVEGGEYTNINRFKDMMNKSGLRVIEFIRPISFLGIFKNRGDYKELRITLVIFLRFVLAARNVYFIWSKRGASEIVE